MLDTNKNDVPKYKQPNQNAIRRVEDDTCSKVSKEKANENYKIDETEKHPTKFRKRGTIKKEISNRAEIKTSPEDHLNDPGCIEIKSTIAIKSGAKKCDNILNESNKPSAEMIEDGRIENSIDICQLSNSSKEINLDSRIHNFKTCIGLPNAGPQPTKSARKFSINSMHSTETHPISPTSPQPTTSRSTYLTENHTVHFANKNEKQSSISIGHFSIYLDRLDYQYRPSDILTGKLHILLEEGRLNLRRVVIYMKGISSVKFTEREYQSTSQNEKHFEDVEYWSDHYLVELKTRPKYASDVKVLVPGEYHLPFRFTFPNYGLPSSFESNFGYVRYWIYSEIRSKDKIKDTKERDNIEETNIATSELPVEVYSPCSIPIEELRRPINAEQLKVMGCLGCCTYFFRNPDFIQVRANIMHQGQRKGSSVQVNLFVVNRSRKQIQPYVILKAKNEYRATNKTKINEVELIGCPGAIVKPGAGACLQTILIPISYEYPIIYDCPNIIISYQIKILIEIPNSFDINFPQLPIYLVNERFPIKQQNFV